MQNSIGGLNPDASKMFRVRKTCLKMLTKRGYIVDEEDVNMGTDDFKMKFGDDPSRESLTILVEKSDDPTDQLFVFFPTDEKVGVKPIKTYCSRMKEENVLRAIIVVRGNLTPFAKQAIKEMSSHGYRMEYFRDAELLVDITEHKLVPGNSRFCWCSLFFRLKIITNAAHLIHTHFPLFLHYSTLMSTEQRNIVTFAGIHNWLCCIREGELNIFWF